jgi:hypothetical protein
MSAAVVAALFTTLLDQIVKRAMHIARIQAVRDFLARAVVRAIGTLLLCLTMLVVAALYILGIAVNGGGIALLLYVVCHNTGAPTWVSGCIPITGGGLFGFWIIRHPPSGNLELAGP